MATISDIEDALRERLSKDAKDELKQAGEMWKEIPLRFYYGNNDQKVDIGIGKAITAAITPRTLPDDVWENLRDTVDPTTVVKKAIKTMWLANLGAVDD